MPEKFKAGCVIPTVEEVTEIEQDVVVDEKGVNSHMLQVGKKAPDFTLSGYQNGEFYNFKLSDYQGKWVVLCFYPGDFTFV